MAVVFASSQLACLHSQHDGNQKTLKTPERKPDSLISYYANTLHRCRSLSHGRSIHSVLTYLGLDQDRFLRNLMIVMYSNCGSLQEARHTFETMLNANLVSWNAMISAYNNHGEGAEALRLFDHLQLHGLHLDRITHIGALNACSIIQELEKGTSVHASIISRGIELDVVLGTAVIQMHGNCHNLQSALCIFNSLNYRDIACWNAMIGVYANLELGKEALELFEQLEMEGFKPNPITFVNVLSACTSEADLLQGKIIHQHIIDYSFTSDVVVGTALISMYAKCGSLKDAQMVFVKLNQRDIVCWSTMIGAFAQHGFGEEAVDLLNQMFENGVKPNEITFISILNACSHEGFVEKGCELFALMIRMYGIRPIMKHYGCIIDLFGRSARTEHALDVIETMPFQASSLLWETLLAACKTAGDQFRGEYAAKQVMRLTPHKDSAYVLLSDLQGFTL